MQFIIPYASFGSLGLFQVFWFPLHGRPACHHRSLKLLEKLTIRSNWIPLTNRKKHIERYPCVSVSSAQKILVVTVILYKDVDQVQKSHVDYNGQIGPSRNP